VASEPPRIIWSKESLDKCQRLEHRTREQILRRVEFLKTNPMPYQVETQGPWAGLRRFRALELIVCYTYWHQDNTVYIEAIVPARSEQR
jgi:mRNA-degrading endonuclease RelE of RelBE toxin-antitoxin system